MKRGEGERRGEEEGEAWRRNMRIKRGKTVKKEAKK